MSSACRIHTNGSDDVDNEIQTISYNENFCKETAERIRSKSRKEETN